MGCLNGITPLAIKVLASGIFRLSEKSANSLQALVRTTPLPARMIGCLAWDIICAARATLSWAGSGKVACFTGSGALSVVCWAIFSGNSIKQAPIFSVCASLKALRVTSGIISAANNRDEYFVMGLKMASRSKTWCDSLCRRWVSACPAIATRGCMIQIGVGDTGNQVGRAGPECG